MSKRFVQCVHREIARPNHVRGILDDQEVSVAYCHMCDYDLWERQTSIRVKDINTGEEFAVRRDQVNA